MKHLQICMFDRDFYLQQVTILHLDVKDLQRNVKDVKKNKSHFFQSSLIFQIYFFEIKKFSDFCRCNSHLMAVLTITNIDFFRRFIRTPEKTIENLPVAKCFLCNAEKVDEREVPFNELNF